VASLTTNSAVLLICTLHPAMASMKKPTPHI
jgi:hypothetical protein